VSIAFALAWDDARSGGLMQPTTREALRRMWSRQRPDGSWARLGCGQHLPAENAARYTVVLAALASAVAPEGYVRMAEAQDGLTRLRRYFMSNPARTTHDQALLLWASLHLDGLMTSAERSETVQRLLGRHSADGGWSFAGLTEAAGSPVNRGHPSDGYGTGLAIYVLREVGVAADHPQITAGLHWLRGNQRVSGRWFTPSPAAGDPTETEVGTRDLYVQNLGTAFSLLALKACEGRQRRPASTWLLTFPADRHGGSASWQLAATNERSP
jgi:squalene-hopene/tetraprenyl-beta-curcumene cyclase